MSAVLMNAAAAVEHPAGNPLERVGGWRGFMRYLGGVTLLVGLYYGAAKLGYVLGFTGPVGAVAWLPVGVAASFLAIFGLSYWPGAVIADVLVNNALAGLPVAGGLGQTLANLLEVLIIAWFVRRRWRESSPAGVSDVGWLAVALAAGTAVSAILGPLSLWLGGAISHDSLPQVMRTWWLGDFCGALVIVPLVLAWRRFPRILISRRIIEGAIALAAIGVLSVAAAGIGEPLTYIVFPILVWTVFRFGMRGATLAVLVTVSATIITETQARPFASDSFDHSVLSTQLFVVVAALSALFFAAVMQEHRVLQNELAFSRARAIHVAELERTRIERDLHDGAQQRLLALAIRLGLAADREPMSSDEARGFLLDANRELELAIDELRELSHGTHPAVLRELGLAGAIRSLALRSVVPVRVSELPSLRLDEAAEATAYFVSVEAVANVHKYARATGIWIDIHYSMPWLHVGVVDNGQGGAVERPGSGLGGLRQRVESIGGKFSLESDERGTKVAGSVPAFPSEMLG